MGRQRCRPFLLCGEALHCAPSSANGSTVSPAFSREHEHQAGRTLRIATWRNAKARSSPESGWRDGKRVAARLAPIAGTTAHTALNLAIRRRGANPHLKTSAPGQSAQTARRASPLFSRCYRAFLRRFCPPPSQPPTPASQALSGLQRDGREVGCGVALGWR